MLRIRLSRTGAKKQPSYRIVVADVEAKRDGRIVERIGHYNPRREPIEYRIDEDRALYWLSVGAQPSDPVQRLLVKQGTLERLARLRKGESRASLVAEYAGVDVWDEHGNDSDTPAETITADVEPSADVMAAVKDSLEEEEEE